MFLSNICRFDNQPTIIIWLSKEMLYSRNIVKNSSENGQQINYRPGYYSSIYGRGGQPAARDIPQCDPQSLKMRMGIKQGFVPEQ